MLLYAIQYVGRVSDNRTIHALEQHFRSLEAWLQSPQLNRNLMGSDGSESESGPGAKLGQSAPRAGLSNLGCAHHQFTIAFNPKKEFFFAALDKILRLDGREFLKARPYSLSIGAELGHVECSLGKTR